MSYPTTAIFVDSSLDPSAISHYPNVTIYPAVKRGDIYSTSQLYDRIIIVDGLFANARSVWQREIIYALSIGIEVFGTSSMGALRASELKKFGMSGFGWVYSMICTGVFEGDDEVSLLYTIKANKDIVFHSIPYCNVYWNLEQLIGSSSLTSHPYSNFLDSIKILPFFERSLQTISALSSKYLPPDISKPFIGRLQSLHFDIKLLDISSLLNQLYPLYKPMLSASFTRKIIYD